MTSQLKEAVVIAVLAIFALCIIGAYEYPQFPQLATASPQGSTSSTAKFYSIQGINLAAPGTNATSSSIQNNSGQDLYISALKVGCEGLGASRTAYTGTGLLALTATFATSSTAAPATAGGLGQSIGGGALTIATSTGTNAIASSTAMMPGNTNIWAIWPAGSFLTVQTNATNTAICTFGADAFSS